MDGRIEIDLTLKLLNLERDLIFAIGITFSIFHKIFSDN